MTVWYLYVGWSVRYMGYCTELFHRYFPPIDTSTLALSTFKSHTSVIRLFPRASPYGRGIFITVTIDSVISIARFNDFDDSSDSWFIHPFFLLYLQLKLRKKHYISQAFSSFFPVVWWGLEPHSRSECASTNYSDNHFLSFYDSTRLDR